MPHAKLYECIIFLRACRGGTSVLASPIRSLMMSGGTVCRIQ